MPTRPVLALASALACSGLAAAPAHAAPAAVCHVEVPVRIAGDGWTTTVGKGAARCVGSVGRGTVDPSPAPARFEGSVLRRFGSCLPMLDRGRLEIDLRSVVSFDPRPTIAFAADLTGSGPSPATVVRGGSTAEGVAGALTGLARWASSGAGCTSGAGTLTFDLHVGAAQRTVRRSAAVRRPRG